MKKRYVFDLDGTLLTGDYRSVDRMFIEKFGEAAIPFVENMSRVLSRYERTFQKYDYEMLSRFLSLETGLNITKKMIQDWDESVQFVSDTEEETVRETLEHLKSQGKSLVVLTNWFGGSQKERLRRADLLSYFDEVYGGDIVTKPHREAYFHAISPYSREESLFIGDTVSTDYIGPRACLIDSVLYDKNNREHNTLVKVKRINELKKY